MRHPRAWLGCVLGALGFLLLSVHATSAVAVTIVEPAEASLLEHFAAKEARRYVYLRTGKLPTLTRIDGELPKDDVVIVVARRSHPVIPARVETPLGEQLVVDLGEKGVVVLAGETDLATLHAVYRFVEHLGVRFYLHGDVIPDAHFDSWETLWGTKELQEPVFQVRGILPFHDFPEGPDLWSADDYKAVNSQLAKLRMNFIGLHNYADHDKPIEPTVWIGLPSDVGAANEVLFSYPSSYDSSARTGWGYSAKPTSEFFFGAASLFERDDWGAPVMLDLAPSPATPAASNQLFARTGELLRAAFTHAGQFGIQRALGTEAPLFLPPELAARVTAAGTDESRSALYEGIFKRIQQTHPLDYYWLWTREFWHFRASIDQDAALSEMLTAADVAKRMNVPFKLAMSGWIQGASADFGFFDRALPKDMPLSSLNRSQGAAPIEPEYAQMDRPKWAIPWLEDDPAITVAQLWVERLKRDASLAAQYGMDGLIGIHWRTRVVAPNVGALAALQWRDTATSVSAVARTQQFDVAAFYKDWALAEFGPEVAEAAGALFASLDGAAPRPAEWHEGPGMVKSGGEYGFVEQLEALQPQVQGAQNQARFDYWLSTFRYVRYMGSLREYPEFLPHLYQQLLNTVSSKGELGTIFNWERHIFPWLGWHGFSKQYNGPPKLIVPTVRGQLDDGESLNLEVMVLDAGQPKDVRFNGRALGAEEFTAVPFEHVARGVFHLRLSGAQISSDFEYFVSATGSDGTALKFPAGAPELNQTVVVLAPQPALTPTPDAGPAGTDTPGVEPPPVFVAEPREMNPMEPPTRSTASRSGAGCGCRTAPTRVDFGASSVVWVLAGWLFWRTRRARS